MKKIENDRINLIRIENKMKFIMKKLEKSFF